MKRKNADDDEVVTRGILRTELTGLRKELRKELKKELRNYPTRKELREELAFALQNYPTKDEFKEYQSEIMTKLDELVGVMAQIREDQLFMNHDISELKQSDADLDVRIKRLEASRRIKN